MPRSCFVAAFSLLMIVASLAPSVQALDETAEAQALLAKWDEFDAYIRQAKKDLGVLQLQHSGSENPAQREQLETAYTNLRTTALKRSKDLWNAINAFLATHPNNVAVRQRRLEDKLFDAISPRTRAEDAERLFEITKKGEFVHEAARQFEKCYDYAAALKYWKTAAERAESFQVLKSLGDAGMNAFEFAASQAAYRRAAELSTAPKDKQEVERMATLAASYVNYWAAEQMKRAADETANLPRVQMETTRGTMLIELFEDDAPNTVANFVELVEKGFFDGTMFHRNIAYFMIQGGDPEGTGRGGPGYNVRDETELGTARHHFPLTLSMANSGQPDTNGSQFFVTSTTTHWLNGRHTVFGRVIEGGDVPCVLPRDLNNPNNEAAPFKLISAKVIRKRDHPYVAEKITR